MNKYVVLLILISFHFVSFSQTKNYNKITFIYKSKPNITFKGYWAYADTLLLQLDYPKIKYQLIKSPEDSLKKVGVFFIRNLSPEDLKKLRNFVFHAYTKKIYKYNLKRTVSSDSGSLCKDEECKKIFELSFETKTNGSVFETGRIKYNEKNKKIKRTNFFITDYDYKDNLIEWVEGFENVGRYIFKGKYNYYTNIIEFNPELDKHITPIPLFANCEYGIQKLYTLYTTTELVSVIYK